jgi:uncharacterized protein
MKSALITGASSGIGAATALEFARQGMDILLVARRADRLEQLAAKIQQSGGKAFCFPTNLSIAENTHTLVEWIVKEYGVPDILVNNAGLGWYGYFSEMPEAVIHEMLMVNIYASVQLTRLFLPAFKARNSGHIINIGSIAGGFPNQGVALYSSTKAFLDAFTSSLYRELRRSRVRISVVRAGPVKTDFFSTAQSQPGGGAVPAERFAISAEAIAHRIWSLVQRPHKVTYIPRILAVTPWIESIFGGLIDRLGPLLLERTSKN